MEGIFKRDSSEGSGGSSKNPLLIVDVSYNNDSIKGAAVKVDTTTKTTKSNGLAIFADTGKGEKQIDVQGSGFQEYTTTKQVKTTTVVEVELQPLVITFTVRDDEENLLQGASITFNSETKTTDANGQASFAQVGVGSKAYSITKDNYSTATGTINVAYENEQLSVTIANSLNVGKSTGTYSVGDTVKLNEGMGLNDYEYTAYPSGTTSTNDLTIEGEVAEVKDNVIKLTTKPSPSEGEITIVADEDDCDISFNNEKDIKEITINASAQRNVVYNCFKNGAETIYFLNGCPFVPRLNTDGTPYSYNGLSFTYYTKDNNEMVSHSFTTDSSGDNICGYSENGEVKFSAYSSGASLENMVRSANDDISVDDGILPTITSESYLNTIDGHIPTDGFYRVTLTKLNDGNWESELLVNNGKVNFVQGQQVYLKTANNKLDFLLKKVGGSDVYTKTVTVSATNYTVRKQTVKVAIANEFTTEQPTIKLTVGGISFVATGVGAISKTLQAYQGDVLSYEVSCEGYTKQTGTWTIPSDKSAETQKDISITLVATE